MRWPKRTRIGIGALLALVPLVGTFVAKSAARDPDTTGTALSSARE
jgi:hypothetical protein